MAHSPGLLNGNTAWAQNYAHELRKVITEHGNNSDRNLQVHLGPSELGEACDRQVAAKMAAVARTNHVMDPWASIVGTALHMWLEVAFTADNSRTALRWLTERRVTPHPDHPGTADLYDAREQAVVDWKNLGDTSMAKVKAADGPPRKYVVQLLLYGRGYRNLGLPVKRVVLAALPRTKSTMDSMWVWERLYTPADDELLQEVFAQTLIRKVYAQQIRAGVLNWMDIPATPSDESCYFCPMFRPESAHNPNAGGCPGHSAAKHS